MVFGQINQGSVIGEIPGTRPTPVEPTPREACKATGGYWDEETQTCLSTKPTPDPFPKSDKTFDITTGKETTAQAQETNKTLTPEERTALPDGANIITDRFGNERIQTREDLKKAQEDPLFEGGAAQAIQQQEAQAAAQQRLQQLTSTIGTIGGLKQAQEADINYSQALTAGTVGQLPSILSTAGSFAVGGAIAGGAPTAGIGAVPGAIIGGGIGIIAGIARGIMGNIKEQQRGELQAAKLELTNARTNMRQLAMLASQDPQNADVYINAYNSQLTRVYQARRQTKAEVSGDLNAFMEDGREQLANIDLFLQEGGSAEIYGQKMQNALLTGAPIDISGEEFLA